jgi:Arc/MetJ family transcription regulator
MMLDFGHHDAYSGDMRTTINLDDDVAREVARLRRERGLGMSEAVNELVRAGLRPPRTDYTYKHPTRKMGALVDLSNVADVLELLDEADRGEAADRDS